MQLDKKVIGHEFKPFSTTVEAGKVKLFCKAIGEEDPIYADEAAAKAAGYRAVPVPPTFLQAITNDDPERGGLLRLLNVDIGLILHGEQHYDYYAPVFVGDRITCQAKVTDMYDKKGGRKKWLALPSSTRSRWAIRSSRSCCRRSPATSSRSIAAARATTTRSMSISTLPRSSASRTYSLTACCR